ncbi:MAG: ATP-binding cassette domain-containing protein [Pyrinomonadaceae bacterium]
MANVVISTETITKEFGRKVAVRDLSLEVQLGSIYAFLGPNGAGKSTTIRLLLGLLRPTRGNVALFGLDLRRNRSEILGMKQRLGLAQAFLGKRELLILDEPTNG